MIQRQSTVDQIEEAGKHSRYRFDDPLLSVELQRLVSLAAQIASVPMAFINTVDLNSVTVRASVGFTNRSVPKEESFCSRAIMSSDPLIVTNAKADPRFYDLPQVRKEDGIVFYCGISILDDNRFAIGTVCVVDSQVRFLTESQIHALKIVANQAAYLIGKFSTKLEADGDSLRR